MLWVSLSFVLFSWSCLFCCLIRLWTLLNWIPLQTPSNESKNWITAQAAKAYQERYQGYSSGTSSPPHDYCIQVVQLLDISLWWLTFWYVQLQEYHDNIGDVDGPEEMERAQTRILKIISSFWLSADFGLPLMWGIVKLMRLHLDFYILLLALGTVNWKAILLHVK